MGGSKNIVSAAPTEKKNPPPLISRNRARYGGSRLPGRFQPRITDRDHLHPRVGNQIPTMFLADSACPKQSHAKFNVAHRVCFRLEAICSATRWADSWYLSSRKSFGADSPHWS